MIAGNCMNMCPQSEIKRRQKDRLVHVLECDESSAGRCSRERVGVAGRMVKCFTRSAAGRQLADPAILRPPSVLLKTCLYLIDEVLFVQRCDVKWPTVYEFCMDRLRCVRQDIVIQQCCDSHSLTALRLCVLFHLISSYRSRECSICEFDDHINTTHLQQCIGDVIRLQTRLHQHDQHSSLLFEAVYLLLNIDDCDAYNRFLNLRIKSSQLDLAVRFRRAYQCGNYVRCFRLVRRMCPLLQLSVFPQLARVRRHCFMRISASYRLKSVCVPLCLLADWLAYDDVTEARRDVTSIGGSLLVGESVFFERRLSADCVQLKNGRYSWLDEMMASSQKISEVCSLSPSTDTHHTSSISPHT